MKKMNVYMAIAIMAIVFSACNQAPPELDMAAVRAAIEAKEMALQDAENAKDIEGALTYYADDAVSMPNHEPVRNGKAAIRAAYEEDMNDDGRDYTIKFEVTDVMAQGNMAVESGVYIVTGTDGMELNRGKYISVFEKRNGEYVCVRDIWNSDKPAKDDDDDGDMDEDDMSENGDGAMTEESEDANEM